MRLSAGTRAKITEILEAETEDLVELMRIADLDPRNCWRYSDLSGVEAGDADVTGWDFCGTNLTEANLSQVRNIDRALFNADTTFDECKLPNGVTVADLLKKAQS